MAVVRIADALRPAGRSIQLGDCLTCEGLYFRRRDPLDELARERGNGAVGVCIVVGEPTAKREGSQTSGSRTCDVTVCQSSPPNSCLFVCCRHVRYGTFPYFSYALDPANERRKVPPSRRNEERIGTAIATHKRTKKTNRFLPVAIPYDLFLSISQPFLATDQH
jgi:hypothetical protein